MGLDQKEKDRKQDEGKGPAAEINRRARKRPGAETAIPERDRVPGAAGDRGIGAVEADAAGGRLERSQTGCIVRMNTKRS